MLNVALTGNVAAGKSTVAKCFRHWGATIIDADELVHEVQAPGSPVLGGIVRRFGPEMLLHDGSLDRAALRNRVMGDPAARRILESLVHPAVQRRREALLDAAWKRGDQIVVNDIPLLFEALDPAQFDVVVFVDAPHTVRRTRLRALRGLEDEEADELLAAQAPADRKRKRSDFVIDNEGSFDALEHRAREVYDELVRRANAKPKT
jgi:dephospho-CoA kinase